MKRKRVAIYCRVDRGGDTSDQQNILAIQKKLLEQYAASHRLQVSGCYQDAGYSSQDFSRPGLNKMSSDYQMGRFDAVLIVKYNQLLRGNIWNEPQWSFPVISADPLEQVYHCKKEQ